MKKIKRKENNVWKNDSIVYNIILGNNDIDNDDDSKLLAIDEKSYEKELINFNKNDTSRQVNYNNKSIDTPNLHDRIYHTVLKFNSFIIFSTKRYLQ